MIFLMNFLFWNCRGAGNRKFQRNVKELLKEVRPAVLALVEPRISGNRASRVASKLKFAKFHVADPVG